METTFIGSPNFTKGRAGKKPIAIVIHIMEGTLKGTAAWFKNPNSDVSSHYGVGKKGEIHQYVNEEDTAWCNGRVVKPTWKGYDGKTNPNLTTLSIEHEGDHNDEWPKDQKQASALLVKTLCEKWGIPLDRDHVIGHYQIYAVKANCPADNKDIIDEIVSIAKSLSISPMVKELKNAYKKAIGEDPGDNLNDSEEKKLASWIEKKIAQPDNSEQVTELKNQITQNNILIDQLKKEGEKNAKAVEAFRVFQENIK